MAEEKYLVLRLQTSDLSCIICISTYKHPTTLQCGHTFCKGCIEQYWSAMPNCTCPVCKAAFPNKPQLNKNTSLASILESLQEASDVSHQDCQSCTGPGAVRLCLPCMTPLCRDHVLLHREDPIQQRHLLVDVLSEDSPWPCRHHEKGLQYFCASYGTPLCPACVVHHQDCKPQPLLNLYRDKKDKVQKRIGDLSTGISSKEQDITDMKNAFRETQILVSDIKDNLTKDFQEMRDYIEKQERASFWRIKQEQDEARRKMTEGINPIMTALEEMKMLKAKLENTLQNDWLQLLKDTSQDNNALHKPLTTDIRNHNMLDENRIIDTTFAISNIKQSLLAHPLLEQVPCPPKKVIEDTVDIPSAAPSTSAEPLPEKPKENKEISLNPLLEWACDISFDLNTVNNRLYVSDGNKKVTVTGKSYSYHSHSRRFTNCQVMCSQAFSSGRWYWEINAKSSQAWAIGVVCKEIGASDDLGRNERSWCVEWNKKLSAWHRKEDATIPLPKPDTVGVLLDCAEKTISFYSISEGSQDLLHSYNLRYQTEIFPAVWLYGLRAGNYLTINDLKRL
uniref:Uncharacterized protein n=1 Tax=Leptobrachium leishanense TaxID=445787 RepID=A0A8C5R2T3_9ANUR